MAVFGWKDEYALGIGVVDGQHRQLVRMIGDLHRAMAEDHGQQQLRPIVRQMVEYAGVHFATEEGLMTAHEYPELEAHRREHEGFAAKARELEERLSRRGFVLSLEVIHYLRDWLTGHILGADRRYAPFLLARGVV